VWGERSRVLWGAEAIREVLDGRTYALSAPAFFQLNPEQTVKLYDEVKRAASLTGREIVVDAYCGVGAIGLWLAPEARRVIGMDTVPEAVRNARENAETGSTTRNIMSDAPKNGFPDGCRRDFGRTW